ncbi:MAG: potassium channel family protein [Verrucomicrobiales bacterium]
MKPPLDLSATSRIRARRLFFLLGAMANRGRNVLLVLVANIVAGGLLLSVLDGKSLAEGQYLAFVTACTIGYGDLAPETWGARLVSVAIGFNGLLLTGIIIALSVRALEMAFREDLEKIENVHAGGADQNDRE